jgi:hypothetical protein
MARGAGGSGDVCDALASFLAFCLWFGVHYVASRRWRCGVGGMGARRVRLARAHAACGLPGSDGSPFPVVLKCRPSLLHVRLWKWKGEVEDRLRCAVHNDGAIARVEIGAARRASPQGLRAQATGRIRHGPRPRAGRGSWSSGQHRE